MSRLRDLTAQGLRFGTVGLWATGVYLAVASLARGLGAEPLAANALAYLVATGFSFAGHFYWTFGRTTGHARALRRFLVTSAAGFLLSHALMYLVTDLWHGSFWLALAAVLLTVPLLSWLSGRLWAFR